MKRLIFVNGTMGAGKTATCRELLKRMQPGVFLDGDWCWYMEPFSVTDETKQMVQRNICFLLNNFLACSAYENVIFCWVMHQESILDDLLSGLDLADTAVSKITLTLTPEALTRRVQKDIAAGRRAPGDLVRSLDRLPLYQESRMHTTHLDVSDISPAQAAQKIVEMLR
jgi:hypothetical protein